MQVLKEEIRDRIIAAAIQEFYRNGFEQASMRKIARDSEISVSNMYNYFSGKSKLFDSIVGPFHEELRQLIVDTFNRYSGEVIGGNRFQKITNTFVRTLADLNYHKRQIVVILTERSSGTKYQDTRMSLARLVKDHFISTFSEQGKTLKNNDERDIVLDIIAENLVSGLLAILNNNKKPRQTEANMQTLLTYHAAGIKGLMS